MEGREGREIELPEEERDVDGWEETECEAQGVSAIVVGPAWFWWTLPDPSTICT